ncbi:type II toxin-antitoxin system PemK/MazF family toxin [Anaerocolumna aminovalerica]|uniref:type II toxin-antitoxin system PemK/MazF family toxin n=1 Tax=Anaerocolumna aminovalerica TaxID=1527 RepID=UPI001C0EDE63|nr:type II toxin-antitoxin system PemK/MazF family toxin [Anaerocolumna aminovalerica]
MIRKNLNYKIIKEGDIWKVNIPKSENGEHIQYGEKYVVVMSNNMNNIYSPNISSVVLTSKKRDKRLPVHYTFKAGELEGMWLDTTVLAETYAPIDKKYFIERVGKITEEQKYIIANLVAKQSPMLFLLYLDNSDKNLSYSS